MPRALGIFVDQFWELLIHLLINKESWNTWLLLDDDDDDDDDDSGGIL
jgi:hypothetical protein